MTKTNQTIKLQTMALNDGFANKVWSVPNDINTGNHDKSVWFVNKSVTWPVKILVSRLASFGFLHSNPANEN